MSSPFPPIEPDPTRVRFPDPARSKSKQVLAIGCDFTPGTVLAAYRSGIFPWPHGNADDPDADQPLVLWFSPDPRCIFPLDEEPHWSRSLRRTLRHHPYEITVDEDFRQVIRLCGETRSRATWIIPELVDGYEKLHDLGWVHSVEVWEKHARGRELVGGIYGVAFGGLFAGESMFHTRTDASKIAFANLVMKLRANGFSLFDVQVQNPHLESLGCIEISRTEYLARLAHARAMPNRRIS